MWAKIKRILQIAGQVGFLTLAWLVGNAMVRHFALRIPGNVVGMVLVFVLLRLKLIRLSWLEVGANWLLAEMLLFFIPAAVGIMQYQQMMAKDGLRIMLVIITSTLAVMACTGLVVERIARRKEERAQ